MSEIIRMLLFIIPAAKFPTSLPTRNSLVALDVLLKYKLIVNPLFVFNFDVKSDPKVK